MADENGLLRAGSPDAEHKLVTSEDLAVFEQRFRRLIERRTVDECVRVLERSSPDFEDLLVNLCEPVATNAIGLAVTGADPAPLRISDEVRTEIAMRLDPLTGAERERAIREAALATCDFVGIHGGAVAYLAALVPELLPRIEVALAHGDLRGVFVG